MVCAGYMFLDVEESQGGDAAKAGTAAGEYLQSLLEKKPMGSTASNGVFIDDEMKFYTHPIAEDVFSRAVGPVLCETRIDWNTESGIVIRGQYDIAFVDNRGYLCIEDLKYGYGIVEVKENWQLLGYAIGEVIRRGQSFTHISFKIHQPRPHHEDGSTREWLLTYAELLEYKYKIEERMKSIVEGNRSFQTSSQCKYCKGAAEACTAFSRLFYRALEVSTEFYQDSLTDEEISRQLDQIRRAEEVIKIKSDSLTDLAISKIKQGTIIPNYVTEVKYGHRGWKNGVTPDVIKAMTGKDITERVIMTPAKAEKAGISKDLVKSFSESRGGGLTLKKKNSTEIGNKIFGTNNPVGGN